MNHILQNDVNLYYSMPPPPGSDRIRVDLTPIISARTMAPDEDEAGEDEVIIEDASTSSDEEEDTFTL